MINVSHKFIYVGVPKTGTTSIETFIKKNYKILPSCQSKHWPISLHEPEYLDYFKFAFVRNPWDWVVSWFSYKEEQGKWGCISSKNSIDSSKKSKFKKWLFETFKENEKLKKENSSLNKSLCYRPLYLSQSEYISIGGELKMDFIGRFESLQKDFDFVCEKLKIYNNILDFRNKSFHDHYSSYYDRETVDFVKEKYKDDVNNFNYAFEEIYDQTQD